jgi:hypothetical protein
MAGPRRLFFLLARPSGRPPTRVSYIIADLPDTSR